MSKAAISVSNVSKTFKLPHEKHNSIKGLFVNLFHGRRTYEKQQALQDISFEIQKGEFFGIVGRNGSGKSTLLKMLAGIYSPDKGKIQINGKLTPFIELGVGFNPELTGRENVFLNGALLGFNREEMNTMYDDIVHFAELEKFMDQKLKNYSSGMQVRLAFSIAIRAKSDILLLDEVLAVGDINFQRKCFEYFNQLKAEKRTVVFVSHDMASVEKYCDKAALIVDSKLIQVDNASVIASHYNRLMVQEAREDASKESLTGKTVSLSGEERWGNGDVHINTVSVDQLGDNRLHITVNCRALTNIPQPIIGYSLKNATFSQLHGTNTDREKIKVPPMVQGKEYTYNWEMNNIVNEGTYYIDCTIASGEATNICDRWAEAATIKVVRDQINPYPLMSNDITFDINEVRK